MSENPKIIQLAEQQTQVKCDDVTQRLALRAAHRVTLSMYEWEWALSEQESMARYVLWAHQRLSAINQCVNGELKQYP